MTAPEPTIPALWEIAFAIPDADHLNVFEDALGDVTAAVTTMEDEAASVWRVTAFAEAAPDEGAMRDLIADAARGVGLAPPEVSFGVSAARDWVAESQRGLKPLQIGGYFVFGAHVDDPPPAGSIPLQIDAGLAFGTGAHETTAGCLEAFDRLYPGETGPARSLDVGTGSGILAIALAKRYGVPVLATDNDPIAVDIAAENAAINGAGALVSTLVCEGFDDNEMRAGAPYELIAANIVANPLKAMAGDLSAVLAENGRAVLSGLLSEQADDVADVYAGHGLGVIDRIEIGRWVTIVLGRG